MLNRLNPWRPDSRDAPDPTELSRARLRVEYWCEFKRVHLGVAQTLSSLVHGRSNTSVLLKHAMLGEYEAQRLAGEHADRAEDLVLDGAMKTVIGRCRGAYARVNAQAFDDTALAALTTPKDAPTLQVWLAMVSTPFTKADAAIVEATRQHEIDEADRILRFTPEIRRQHEALRKHFAAVAKRAGLV